MLPPDSRVALVDALTPPPGTQLDRGVALTFTLDLESAVIAPLAFVGSRLRDEGLDPIEVLHAAGSCAKMLDIFCQAGAIHVPAKQNGLLSLLEPMVHPVTAPHGGLFHPKLWVLRFRVTGSNERLMRVLIGSRNLTGDHSWDTCLRLDGTIGSRPHAENKQLADLLRYTMSLTKWPLRRQRADALSGLIEDVRRTDWELLDGAQDLHFYAPGVPRATAPRFTGSRSVLISPFWNERGLKLVGSANERIVVGRQEQLDRLPVDQLEGAGVTAYVLNDLAVLDGADAAGQDRPLGLLSGLHAKLYVIEYGHRARILIGSANATDAAFGRNVELLAELTGGRKALGIDALLDDQTGLMPVLEHYVRQPPEAEDEEQHELDNALRAIAAVALTATVSGGRDGEGSWRIDLTSVDPIPDRSGITLSVSLLTCPAEVVPLSPGNRASATFDHLEVTDITPFVIVTAVDDTGRTARTVLITELVNDVPDRLDRLLARQVDTPEKFLKFLALLLGLGTSLEQLVETHGTGAGATWLTQEGVPVLELLMNAAADRPAQLDALGRLVARLEATDAGRKVLPRGFAELWKVIETSRTLVKKGSHESVS